MQYSTNIHDTLKIFQSGFGLKSVVSQIWTRSEGFNLFRMTYHAL